MMDDTTEVGTRCQCGHPAITHMHPDPADERCRAPGCVCVAFMRADKETAET